jgi:WD40 repeat protein
VSFNHGEAVSSAAISPDGALIASASGEAHGNLKLWNNVVVANPQPAAILPHDDEIGFVAFSPDGKIITTITRTGIIRLWDSQAFVDPHPMATIKARVRRIEQGPHIAFSSDLKMVARTEGAVVLLWRNEKLNDPLIATWVSNLMMPAGFRMSFDGEEKLWDNSSPAERLIVAKFKRGADVVDLAFTSDGTKIVVGYADGVVELRGVDGGKEPHLIATFKAANKVANVAISADGKSIGVSETNAISPLNSPFNKTVATVEFWKRLDTPGIDVANVQIMEYARRHGIASFNHLPEHLKQVLRGNCQAQKLLFETCE